MHASVVKCAPRILHILDGTITLSLWIQPSASDIWRNVRSDYMKYEATLSLREEKGGNMGIKAATN